MRRPVSDGMLYAPKLSTCCEAQEIKETGNEEAYHHCETADEPGATTDDLGDRSSYYCVLDETGGILAESKTATSPKAMESVFAAMPPSRIALETGVHSPWVSRVLSKLGHEVIVAHARNVRLIGESRRKDDRMDAQTWHDWRGLIRSC